MFCVICKTGTINKGRTTCTFEKDGSLIVFKNVEAEICDNCGEAYFSLETTEKLKSLTEDAVRKGAEIEVVKMPS
jgi:YgiT-type zinc finger domain-containing protein